MGEGHSDGMQLERGDFLWLISLQMAFSRGCLLLTHKYWRERRLCPHTLETYCTWEPDQELPGCCKCPITLPVAHFRRPLQWEKWGEWVWQKSERCR
jgi:hypothetical protein